MALNDLQLIQEVAGPDFQYRILGSVSAGKVIIIDGASQPALRLLEISDINALQAGLNAKIDNTEKGAANGVATLGADSKVTASQLPSSVVGSMNYQGSWNASTNTPTIATAASGNKGYYYVVSTAGATNIDGITDWKVGDWIVSNGTTWEKIDNTDAVTSVAGLTGAVVLGTSHITGLDTALGLKAPSASPTFTGTVTLPSTTSIGTVSSTELGYIDGVTSAIQTQLNAKQATITGGATTIATSNLTASKALVSDASGKVAVSTVSSTELSYLVGVTSAIQTQINSKQASLGFTAENAANKNAVNGYCGLDSGGKVASAQLPTTLMSWSSVPASATATGTVGEIAQDNDYLYVCVATNVWKRTPMATW